MLVMQSNKIILYGASGHAKVISSIVEATDRFIDIIFDDNDKIFYLNQYRVLTGYDKNYNPNIPIIISIGDNKIRKNISKKISHPFTILIHPSSFVDIKAKIENGTVVFHNAIVQRDSIIGKHCIINTNASIDHDCIINDFVHISPSATLCGNVKVGVGSNIGAGATIIPNINIGKWCVIGAGAVITKDVPDYSLVVGIPGKIIKKLKND
jgi:sugar O-acyltransferase (sialic acid O-acetyltransferase NeuD family)